MVKTMSMAHGQLDVSQILLGCMRMSGLSKTEAARLVHTALDEESTF